MHLMDGVVSAPMLAGGFAVAGGVCAWSAWRIQDEEIPRLAVFTAAFYIASLIHFPLPGTSVHLAFSGLMGVILGRRAFLAIPVGLFLQFAMFGHGGLTVLGVNACIFGLPALASWKIYETLSAAHEAWVVPAAALCGALGVFFSGILFCLALLFSDEKFTELAWFALVLHIPVMIVESIATACTVAFLRRVQPSMVKGGAV